MCKVRLLDINLRRKIIITYLDFRFQYFKIHYSSPYEKHNINYISNSVMQSDGNSFGGDVVLESFSMANRDEGSILDQKYEKQTIWVLYYEDFSYLNWSKKMHI